MVRITVCALLLGSVGIVSVQFAVYSSFAGEKTPLVKLFSDNADVSNRNSKGKNHSFSPFSSVPRWTDEIRIYRPITIDPALSKDFVNDAPSPTIYSIIYDPPPTEIIEFKLISQWEKNVIEQRQLIIQFDPILIDQWIKARPEWDSQ